MRILLLLKRFKSNLFKVKIIVYKGQANSLMKVSIKTIYTFTYIFRTALINSPNMRKICLSLFTFLILTNFCISQEVVFNDSSEIINVNLQLDKYLGKLITIKGLVSNTKIPTIIGVDIVSEDPDLRGEYAFATGVLQKSLVTDDEIDKHSANRGAGTFYILIDPNTNSAVQVQKDVSK